MEGTPHTRPVAQLALGTDAMRALTLAYTHKRPREEEDCTITPDLFLMERLTEVLEEQGAGINCQTIMYSLHTNTFSHPEYKQGTPFTIDAYKEILSYLGGQAGGGKMMFKIAASLKTSRFGKAPNKRCMGFLRKAGFTLVKKARVEEEAV